MVGDLITEPFECIPPCIKSDVLEQISAQVGDVVDRPAEKLLATVNQILGLVDQVIPEVTHRRRPLPRAQGDDAGFGAD